MAKRSQSAGVFDSIRQMVAQKYEAAITEIDDVLRRHGIISNGDISSPHRSRVRSKASTRKRQKTTTKPAGQGKRRNFAQTAEAFVLSQVAGKGASTSEINQAWKRSGRGGTADNTLSAMVKTKKIKRTPNKGGRGSTYSRG